MPLNWPGMYSGGGTIQSPETEAIRGVINQWADIVEARLGTNGLSKFASPIFKPFNLVVMRDPQSLHLVFTALTGGTAEIVFTDSPGGLVTTHALAAQVVHELGREPVAMARLPRPDAQTAERSIVLAMAAEQHVNEVNRAMVFAKVKGMSDRPELEGPLREFLQKYPDPDRNVFVMMRFTDSPQLNSVYETIKSALAARDFNAVRADDRDYTGHLWSNIQVYLTGCNYGVAVFEQIDQRDFNPNVALELGYMFGQGKRCLLLKEQRLDSLPSDVVGHLYKEFDSYKIEDTVTAQVTKWVSVDLGVGG